MNPNGLGKIGNRSNTKSTQAVAVSERKKIFTAKRLAIAVATFLLVAGTTIGLLSFRNKSEQNASAQENTTQMSKNTTDIISSGGTISAAQVYDYLGMESTNIKLTVEEVYASAGDTVTEGDSLYKLTDASVQKAASTLESELKSAQSALLNQTLSYVEDKNEAYSLYQSELLVGEQALSEYKSGLTSLDNTLQAALDAYQEAQNTINTAPATIAQKQSELSNAEQEASSGTEQLTSLQQTQENSKAAYEAAAKTYNTQVNDYNAAAGVVRYLGAYIGADVSDVALADLVSVSVSSATSSSAPSSTNDSSQPPSNNGSGMLEGNFDFSGSTRMMVSGVSRTQDAPDENAASMPQPSQGQTAENDSISALYQNARQEYDAKKQSLSQAMQAYKSAENSYKSTSEAVINCQNAVKSSSSSVSSLEKEISTLQSSLTKANSEVTSLKSKYTSLKNSYEADKLTLQNTYDTSVASGMNAEYHYQLTLSTIEDEFTAAQDAVTTAEENQKIFNEAIADGIIKAQQSGTLASVTYETNNVMKVSSATVSYVDNTSFWATVELDQYDVTEIAIGDEVIIYASDSGMVNATVKSISAGENTSLANVKFNVTVAVDDTSKLYSGESVNVYFNAMSLDTSAFRDAEASEDKTQSEDGNNSGAPEEFNFDDFSGFGGEGFSGKPPQMES